MQALFLWSRPRFGARLVPVRNLLADKPIHTSESGLCQQTVHQARVADRLVLPPSQEALFKRPRRASIRSPEGTAEVMVHRLVIRSPPHLSTLRGTGRNPTKGGLRGWPDRLHFKASPTPSVARGLVPPY